MRMVVRVVLVMVLLGLCVGTDALANRATQRLSAQVSTLMRGSIDIGIDGAVEGYRIHKSEKFPASVLGFVDLAVRRMRFEPVVVDGKNVKARAGMALRLVAIPAKDDADQFRLRLVGASFGDEEAKSAESVVGIRLDPPKYPPPAFNAGIAGTVYLVLKVGKDGNVAEVAVEQTNLTNSGSEAQLRRGRELLENASREKARAWTFQPPTEGAFANAGYWSVRVPVEFLLSKEPLPDDGYGIWQTYVPGPRQRVPWIDGRESKSSPEALAAGTPYMVGSGPRLLMQPGEG